MEIFQEYASPYLRFLQVYNPSALAQFFQVLQHMHTNVDAYKTQSSNGIDAKSAYAFIQTKMSEIDILQPFKVLNLIKGGITLNGVKAGASPIEIWTTNRLSQEGLETSQVQNIQTKIDIRRILKQESKKWPAMTELIRDFASDAIQVTYKILKIVFGVVLLLMVMLVFFDTFVNEMQKEKILDSLFEKNLSQEEVYSIKNTTSQFFQDPGVVYQVRPDPFGRTDLTIDVRFVNEMLQLQGAQIQDPWQNVEIAFQFAQNGTHLGISRDQWPQLIRGLRDQVAPILHGTGFNVHSHPVLYNFYKYNFMNVPSPADLASCVGSVYQFNDQSTHMVFTPEGLWTQEMGPALKNYLQSKSITKTEALDLMQFIQDNIQRNEAVKAVSSNRMIQSKRLAKDILQAYFGPSMRPEMPIQIDSSGNEVPIQYEMYLQTWNELLSGRAVRVTPPDVPFTSSDLVNPRGLADTVLRVQPSSYKSKPILTSLVENRMSANVWLGLQQPFRVTGQSPAPEFALKEFQKKVKYFE